MPINSAMDKNAVFEVMCASKEAAITVTLQLKEMTYGEISANSLVNS